LTKTQTKANQNDWWWIGRSLPLSLSLFKRLILEALELPLGNVLNLRNQKGIWGFFIEKNMEFLFLFYFRLFMFRSMAEI
jgi:hypothetical protein